jgi:hypothetical protein
MQGRYLWRHDNVLKAVALDLRGLVARTNRSLRLPVARPIAHPIIFVPAGHKPVNKPRRKRHATLLSGATDWKIEIDIDNNLIFPTITGVTTLLRPDIVLWSAVTKTIIWGELTCPLEERILESHVKKQARYTNLEAACRVKGWKVHAFQIEVGSIGFVGNSSRRFFLEIGFRNPHLKFLLENMSSTCRKSSFHIWCCRRNKKWVGPPLAPVRSNAGELTPVSELTPAFESPAARTLRNRTVAIERRRVRGSRSEEEKKQIRDDRDLLPSNITTRMDDPALIPTHPEEDSSAPEVPDASRDVDPLPPDSSAVGSAVVLPTLPPVRSDGLRLLKQQAIGAFGFETCRQHSTLSNAGILKITC